MFMNKYKAYLSQYARTEDLNKRIFSRNIPSKNLELPLDFRSINTRETFPTVPTFKYNTFQQTEEDNYKDIFIPGNDSGNFYYKYAANINNENELKNLTVLLDSDADFQSKYIPASNSDMYISQYHDNTDRPNYKTTQGKNINSNNVFFNHTRQQLKDEK